jgi:hypothetical protein
VPYTAFALKKKGQAITARLIVRRIKDLNRKAPTGQGELFTTWRYHALFTDSPFETIEAEAQYRDHAIIKQVFADCNDGPLAHLPSGSFPANAAWLACHNLLRAAATLAGPACAKARSGSRGGMLSESAYGHALGHHRVPRHRRRHHPLPHGGKLAATDWHSCSSGPARSTPAARHRRRQGLHARLPPIRAHRHRLRSRRRATARERSEGKPTARPGWS